MSRSEHLSTAPESAFLQPNLGRRNLAVKTLAHVTKVIFEGKTAVGVEYVSKGEKYVVKAKKEDILSAGKK